MTRNIELLSAQQENASLAVENERTRFARDLHDILGHSLTVITVKAELAQRLLDIDPERARAEIADLERLSRDALSRRTPCRRGLPRADASGRAGPGPHCPGSGRDRGDPAQLRRRGPDRAARALRVDRPRRRHQRDPALPARSCCEVRLTPTSAEVRDDGSGGSTPGSGSGLAGLRERASAVGATVVTQHLSPGFSLQVVRP